MSYRKEKIHSLTGINLNNISNDELKNLCKKHLEKGIHGLFFSAYDEGQEPGDQISDNQIRRKLKIIQPYIKLVRTFSCTEGNERIPIIARELGIKTLVGAWLSDNKSTNDKEINGLISLCNSGNVDIAAVGNEVLYRKELNEEELISYIIKVKKEINEIPVGYVDAYYEFPKRPKLTKCCDVILANCYPYWEGCSLDYSLMYMKQMYNEALTAGKGKKVIVTETGLPSQGANLDGAYPSNENALKYFINSQNLSFEDKIEMFYFSSFDESWKVGVEGDVGAYWGLWDKDENLKF